MKIVYFHGIHIFYVKLGGNGNLGKFMGSWRWNGNRGEAKSKGRTTTTPGNNRGRKLGAAVQVGSGNGNRGKFNGSWGCLQHTPYRHVIRRYGVTALRHYGGFHQNNGFRQKIQKTLYQPLAGLEPCARPCLVM